MNNMNTSAKYSIEQMPLGHMSSEQMSDQRHKISNEMNKVR